MATSRTIPREEWRTYFDGVSKALMGKRVEIEAASLDLGDQIVAEWMPLLGITYDSHDDLFDIALEGLALDHMIRRPRQVMVEVGEQGIESIAVLAEDATHILRLNSPLMLPAADRDHAGATQR